MDIELSQAKAVMQDSSQANQLMFNPTNQPKHTECQASSSD
ncbi:hypothetical protein [Oscillatoria sp. HE19RPO]|nr:hypothetical protein [Oscillatoria sp. HE19RPO]